MRTGRYKAGMWEKQKRLVLLAGCGWVGEVLEVAHERTRDTAPIYDETGLPYVAYSHLLFF